MGNVAMCQPCGNEQQQYSEEDLNKQSKQGQLGITSGTASNAKDKSNRGYPSSLRSTMQSSTVRGQPGQNNRDTFLQPFEEQFQRDKKVGLDDFVLEKMLGKGSFGKVMFAKHKSTSKYYAMKILSKKNIRTERQKRHTKTERFVLEKMNHPFIIKLNFAFQSEEKLYLVLDFMQGGELFQHLQRQGRFKESVAQFYAAEILLAIEHLHQNNIFYRDLKPENVLMGDDGHIKIADFGLSFMTQNLDEYAKSMCGTPEYLAPEILLSKKGHDKTVDWWSLGALIYEMLTGLPPFYSEDKKKMFQNVISKPVPMPSYLSEKSISILKSLLVVDPAKRLGFGPDGAKNIKDHPFFSGIDWDKLYKKEIQSPLKIKIEGSNDFRYFDKHLVKQEIKHTPENPNQIPQIAFSNFTYNGKGLLSKEDDKILMHNDENNNNSSQFQMDGDELDE